MRPRMATYAIGDVQGCAATLQRLLDQLPLDLSRDRVWFVGDLVNRGPASLQALRTVRGLGPAALVVLGNHDLHLLARAAGVAGPKRRDTLEEVLRAEDRDEMVAWLRTCRLAHRTPRHLLVHAGVPPRWSLTETLRRARSAETSLQGPRWREFLAALAAVSAHPGRGVLARRALDAHLLTNLRAVREDGTPDLAFRGPPDAAPEGLLPWFRSRLPNARRRRTLTTVVCGHWSALGYRAEAGVLALDTGCVWGGELTAVRLEDRRRWSVPNAG